MLPDDFCRQDIEKISLEILKHSKALDVFPTPVSKIVEYSELVVSECIDLSKVEHSFIEKASTKFSNLIKNVRGILDRREKTIYLDLTQLPSRQTFVKLHEVGHHVLPWQEKSMSFLDDDETLDSETKTQFEAEANFFASATLFQNDRFIDEMEKLPLSLNSSKYIAKHFGASIHASLRRYVEFSKNRCALVVLENISSKGQVAKCNLRNAFFSKKFKKEFGDIDLPNALGYTWPFVQDYYHKIKFKTDGFLSLITLNGQVNFTYHFFNNGYNGFVFLFPLGEKKRSRTKIIVTASALQN